MPPDGPLLRVLGSGDVGEAARLLGDIDRRVIGHAFADVLDGADGRARTRLVGQYVNSFEGANPVQRRGDGKKTPAGISDVPTEPTQRRSYVLLSVDAPSPEALAKLLAAGLALTSEPARRQAAGRLGRADRRRRRSLGDGLAEQLAIEETLHRLAGDSCVKRLATARRLADRLKDAIALDVAGAREQRVSWRKIGQALEVSAEGARGRFRRPRQSS